MGINLHCEVHLCMRCRLWNLYILYIYKWYSMQSKLCPHCSLNHKKSLATERDPPWMKQQNAGKLQQQVKSKTRRAHIYIICMCVRVAPYCRRLSIPLARTASKRSAKFNENYHNMQRNVGAKMKMVFMRFIADVGRMISASSVPLSGHPLAHVPS